MEHDRFIDNPIVQAIALALCGAVMFGGFMLALGALIELTGNLP